MLIQNSNPIKSILNFIKLEYETPEKGNLLSS